MLHRGLDRPLRWTYPGCASPRQPHDTWPTPDRHHRPDVSIQPPRPAPPHTIRWIRGPTSSRPSTRRNPRHLSTAHSERGNARRTSPPTRRRCPRLRRPPPIATTGHDAHRCHRRPATHQRRHSRSQPSMRTTDTPHHRRQSPLQDTRRHQTNRPALSTVSQRRAPSADTDCTPVIFTNQPLARPRYQVTSRPKRLLETWMRCRRISAWAESGSRSRSASTIAVCSS
jgi:hypothetical protein